MQHRLKQLLQASNKTESRSGSPEAAARRVCELLVGAASLSSLQCEHIH